MEFIDSSNPPYWPYSGVSLQENRKMNRKAITLLCDSTTKCKARGDAVGRRRERPASLDTPNQDCNYRQFRYGKGGSLVMRLHYLTVMSTPAPFTADDFTTEDVPAVAGIGTHVFELVGGEYVEYEIVDFCRDFETWVAALEPVDGEGRTTVDDDVLMCRLANADDSTWVKGMLDVVDDDGVKQWVPHPKHADRSAEPVAPDVGRRDTPSSPKQLTFEKIEGRGSRTEVNTFLDGETDALVFHELGGVSSWRAAFVARYDGDIVSALVLHHYHPSTNGVEIACTRLANNEYAPKNTSTWMLSRARKWAERVGYETLASYAGVGDNEGVTYQAAGFETDGEPVEVDGKNWNGDGGVWTKQKYVYDLEPTKYDSKSDAWALESVADGTVVPGRSGLGA